MTTPTLLLARGYTPTTTNSGLLATIILLFLMYIYREKAIHAIKIWISLGMLIGGPILAGLLLYKSWGTLAFPIGIFGAIIMTYPIWLGLISTIVKKLQSPPTTQAPAYIQLPPPIIFSSTNSQPTAEEIKANKRLMRTVRSWGHNV